MPTTTNMALILPTEGGDADIWDTLLAAVFGLVDAHDHTSGKGVPVPSTGLRINADLPFNYGGSYYAATGVKALDFQPSPAADVAGYAGALWVSSTDNELYYRTTSGSNVKLTSGTALNVSTFTGGIAGDYAAIGAELRFDDATDSYWLRQQEVAGARAWASARLGNVDIYEAAASITNRVRIQSPAALAASYALTLPAALPGSTALAQVSAAGVMTLTNTIGQTVTIQTGANVVLQGTAHVQHGDFTLTVPVVYPDLVVASGSVANNGANLGATQAISSVAYYPIRGLAKGCRIKSVLVQLAAAPGASIDYALALSGVGGFIAFAVAAGSAVSSGTATATSTPSSPMALDTNGYTAWLKVTTPGGSTAVPVWMVVTYDKAGN